MSDIDPTRNDEPTDPGARRGADETHDPADAGGSTQVSVADAAADPAPVVTSEEQPEARTDRSGIEVPVQPGFSRATGVAIALGATALAIGLLTTFADIVAPVFLGVNLLIAAYPVYTILNRLKVPRVLAAIATGLTVLLVLAAGVAAIVWSGTSMVTALRGYSDQFTELYTQAIQLLGKVGFDESALLEQLKTISPSNVLGVVKGLVSNASGATAIILVVLVAMIFMVMDLPSMKERMQITDRLHPAFSSNIESFVFGIRRYWLVTTIFGLIVATLDGGLLLILGVPLPLVWAVLSFITNYIPNVGFIIGLLPPALLALVEKGPVTALIVVLAYSVMNFVIQSIIQPKFTGDAVGITPTVSFISLLLWTAVFGPLGALIALPFTLMIKAMLLDSDPRTRWINALIAANPKTVEEPT
ncbi:MAG: AI-2E family transporter [Arachnia sp.]